MNEQPPRYSIRIVHHYLLDTQDSFYKFLTNLLEKRKSQKSSEKYFVTHSCNIQAGKFSEKSATFFKKQVPQKHSKTSYFGSKTIRPPFTKFQKYGSEIFAKIPENLKLWN